MALPVAYPVGHVITKKEAVTRSRDSASTHISTATFPLASATSATSICLMGAWRIDKAITTSGATLVIAVAQRTAEHLFLACDASCFADPAEQ
eukprot:2949495-Amphidinium_carterae.1